MEDYDWETSVAWAQQKEETEAWEACRSHTKGLPSLHSVDWIQRIMMEPTHSVSFTWYSVLS